MTNLKKVLTAAVMTTLLLIGTSNSYAGIVVAGFGNESGQKQDTCSVSSTGKGILIPDFGGIVVAGLTGIVVAGITGIVVAGVSETRTDCGIVVAG
jgi:hypothetical protein